MLRRYLVPLFTLLVAVAAAVGACGGGGFDPQSRVDSVRMFAARIDKPYARPGDTVNIEVLLADGRKNQTRPLALYWFPVACINPRSDLYYLCFLAAGGDAGDDAGARLVPAGPVPDAGGLAPPTGESNALSRIPTNIDIAPFLPKGTSFSFQVPLDIVEARPGADPYGLVYLFNIACAGQVRLVERDPEGGPQQIPVRCTDEEGRPLPPSEYVIGFVRVYAYETRSNANPVIEGVTYQGAPVDLSQGIRLPPCRNVRRRATDCPEHEINVVVPETSWEENPSEASTGFRREQLWAVYYSDFGELQNDARLLYDPKRGRITDNALTYRAPPDVGDGTIWAVVHDNRGGVGWVLIPVHVREDAPLVPKP
jgi:hypothetical protein